MTLQDMLDEQERAQRNVHGLDLVRLTGEERIEAIRWNVLALEDELHEALAETGWKPWATSRHVNREAFLGELIDAWHFLMNLFIIADTDAEEIEQRYFAKRAKNDKRQHDGYDGVDGKCPGCHRALDDDAVKCGLSTNGRYVICRNDPSDPQTFVRG